MAESLELVNEAKNSIRMVTIPGLLTSVAAAALIGVYGAFCIASAAGESINPNTVVGGRDLGGLTRAQAVTALEPTLNHLLNESGVHALLEDGQEAAYLTYGELGVTFDAESLAQEAYDSSHTSNAFVDGWKLLSASLGKHTAVTLQPNDGWEDTAAERLADATRLAGEDFSYEVSDDDELTLIKAIDGRDVDRNKLRNLLKDSEADKNGDRSVALPCTVVPADSGDLNEIHAALCGTAANARYDAATQSIIPERRAINFDVAQAQALLNSAAPGERVSVPVETSEPEVTAAELEKVLFRDLLGTYTTRVGGAVGRKSNVKLTAQRVNGTVLNSGEEFNYYKLTGPFSASNGYKSAPGYQNGKTVEMDGGGACQCSSTTYAAALLANLEIVARTAHGFASDYIGLGLDATVSGGGPEFIFRNNTAYPIKVQTNYSADNRLTVNIYGTKTDDTTVKMRVEQLSSTPYEEEVIESPDLAPGERRVEQTPYTGHVVNTYRQIYDGNGKLISETFEARSNYKKRNRIVLVGPQVDSGETVAEVEPSPEAPDGAQSDAAPAPVVEPAPPPSDLPGGIEPAPIDEQLAQLSTGTEAEVSGV